MYGWIYVKECVYWATSQTQYCHAVFSQDSNDIIRFLDWDNNNKCGIQFRFWRLERRRHILHSSLCAHDFPQDKMPKRYREKNKLYTALIAKEIHLFCGNAQIFSGTYIQLFGDRYTLCERGLVIVHDLSTSLSQGVSVRNFGIQSLLWYSDGWWHIMNYNYWYTIGRVILCSDSGLWAW